MIEITATTASLKQAQELLAAGVDTLLVGEDAFGLRLAHSFSREEQRALVTLAHQEGRKVTVALNGLMHPEKMQDVPAYLAFLQEIGADQLLVGDPGVIYLLQQMKQPLPYLYDAHTMVTSSRQINFWGKRGAVGAVIAREVPYLELVKMAPELTIFGEVLVYGATCIHQSKRPLLRNYFSYIQTTESQADKAAERALFLSEPERADSHYSIFEDSHGTHIFADNDLNLMPELEKLVALDLTHWKLDGLFVPEADFVAIAKCFVEAKRALLENNWNETLWQTLNQRVQVLHPAPRGLDEGFFLINPNDVK